MRVPRFAASAALLLLAFCNENASSKGTPPGPPEPTAAPSAPTTADAEAKDIYRGRCAMCHGSSGGGDGPTAATLNPKPRDFRDQAWQKSVSDAEIHDAILRGGVAVGKSPLMPPNPDLASKPAVVAELAKMVRAFGPPPGGGKRE